ncbi:DMT family transporter [Candidatus Uhrbacteria bacterium]|nr:DMT family transporter [Candidatus Uhrbacteria bacterium]
MILFTNALISLLLHEVQILPSFSAVWFWQLCYSVVSLFGFWLVIAGLKRVDATIGALIGLLEIVFGVAFGILFFREDLTASVVVGGLLIVGAASLPNVWEMIKEKRVLET